MLDANTQVGNRYSETKVNLFEWHGQTAGWGFGLIIVMALLVLITAYICRRRYKKKLKRRPQPGQLALTYEGGRPPYGAGRPPHYDAEDPFGRRNSLDRM